MNMMFPKEKRKKRQKRHKKSILHQKDGTCYLCGKLNGDRRIHAVTQEHHIFGGANRSRSEEEGLKVYLCLRHHIEGPEAVHNNHTNMRILQRDGQRAFEKAHSRAEFMQIFGRNYLDENSDPSSKH